MMDKIMNVVPNQQQAPRANSGKNSKDKKTKDSVSSQNSDGFNGELNNALNGKKDVKESKNNPSVSVAAAALMQTSDTTRKNLAGLQNAEGKEKSSAALLPQDLATGKKSESVVAGPKTQRSNLSNMKAVNVNPKGGELLVASSQDSGQEIGAMNVNPELKGAIVAGKGSNVYSPAQSKNEQAVNAVPLETTKELNPVQLGIKDGIIEGVSVQSEARPAGIPNNMGGTATLSGAEFLNAMNDARNGVSADAINPSARTSQFNLVAGDGSSKRPVFTASESSNRVDSRQDPVQSRDVAQGMAAAAMAYDMGQHKAPPVEVTGRVVKGAMAMDRLSSESLFDLSSSIRTLTPKGGGEINLRLYPEQLGELRVRVNTYGNNVSLDFQATNNSAKKVLEDSMGYLKSTLEAQKLNLGKVDLSVVDLFGGQNANLTSGQNQTAQNPSNWHGNGQAYQGYMEPDMERGRNGQSYDTESSDRSYRPRQGSVSGLSGLSSMAGSMGSSDRTAGAGRLDVFA